MYIDGWVRFDNAYKDAVASLRGIRSGSGRNKEVADEQRYNFKRKGSTKTTECLPKKPKPSSWTHKFVCLSQTDEERVPTTPFARETLLLAGLGEKKIVIDCSTEEFHEVLLNCFPKLKSGGGFELLRCLPSTRDFEIISSPVCHSP